MNWDEEMAAIIAAARLRNLDPLFIAAIRKTENGSDDIAFGILDGKTHGYQAQLAACAATVRNRLAAYGINPLERDTSVSPPRLRYTEDFIRWFAAIYAPTVGATNDPTSLNKNWIANCLSWYGKFIEGSA